MCKYSGTHGHRTEDCRKLREEVARLFNEGHLREFLSDRAKNHSKERDANKKNEQEEPQHVIHMIVGGVDVPKGPVFKCTKVWITREKGTWSYVSEGVLSFNDEEMEGISQPHNNALETFKILRKYNMKLNPKKYAFGVGSGVGLGIVLKPPTGSTIRQSIKTSRLTNNEAECEAMIADLELAKILGAEVIKAKCNSLLVVNQVNKSFEVREDRMQRYLDKIEVTLHHFKEWALDHVPREQNSEADALANLGSLVEEDDIVWGNVVQLSKSEIEEGHAKINYTSLT
ncbi:uncharacterized protein [Nicotiana sylvestris]|uniref:uncharacterized protein n=1 Tax=Nicotiana sylvestris TaxID=4096 RepID=UPI00388C60B0